MTAFSPTPSSETVAWFREAVKQAPEASPLSDPIYRHAVIRARCDLREADEAFQAALLLARYDPGEAAEHNKFAWRHLESAAKELGYRLVPIDQADSLEAAE